MNKPIVVANDLQAFRRFCVVSHLPENMFFYVTDSLRLRGRKKSLIILVDGWERREDAKEMRLELDRVRSRTDSFYVTTSTRYDLLVLLANMINLVRELDNECLNSFIVSAWKYRKGK